MLTAEKKENIFAVGERGSVQLQLVKVIFLEYNRHRAQARKQNFCFSESAFLEDACSRKLSHLLNHTCSVISVFTPWTYFHLFCPQFPPN